jgi:hypothetical protein
MTTSPIDATSPATLMPVEQPDDHLGASVYGMNTGMVVEGADQAGNEGMYHSYPIYLVGRSAE